MKTVIFVLFLAFGGSTAIGLFDQCDVNKCNHIIAKGALRGISEPPSEEDLKQFCPPVVRMLDCVTDLITECTGQNIEDLAQSSNKTIASMMTLLGGVKDVATDICDEDSNLRKNYLSGVSCFREMMEESGEDCIKEGVRVYAAYRDSLPELLENNDEEGECLVVGYGIACMSMRLNKSCGKSTSETFLEIIRRTKFVGLSYCDVKDVVTLKSTFLDYLEEQGEHRDIFSSAFDFRRRK